MTALLLATLLTAAPSGFEEAFGAAEAAKARGDMAGFESGLLAALRFGDGNEYVWRSLAWAQMHQGKWRESLHNAHENVRRWGAGGWSLEQLAESALLAGDLDLATDALAQAAALPATAIGSAAGALEGTVARLRALSEPRVYDTRWTVDIAYAGATEKPVPLLIPQLDGPRQTVALSVDNAVSWELAKDGYRDVLLVQQKPGEPFTVRARISLKPAFVGMRRLEDSPDGPVPDELAACLGPFQHGPTFDPADPVCAALAAELRGPTPARTVRRILDWFRANFVYSLEVNPETLADIITQKTGKCHHYCAAFTALCRAAGVPAVVAHGVVIQPTGEFSGPPGSHGWAEVWLPEIGWTPVEPLDVTSLASFSAGRAYVYTDCANFTPDDTHFRFTSIQGCANVAGRLLAD